MSFTDLTIDSVTLVQKLKEKNAQLHGNLINVYQKVEPILNTRTSQVFPNYTLHNVKHSLRIMEYMAKLVPDIDKLSDLEISLLVYSALLHDIGMGASQEETDAIKQGSLKYKEIEYKAVLKKFGGNEVKAIEDFIRRVHAFRSSEYIKNNLKGDLIIPNMPNTTFEDLVASICQSHTEDIEWIRRHLNDYGLKGEYTYNLQFCAIILRLADILDFDSQRTPPKLFDAISPQGISRDEWVQHFSIENIEKIRKTQDGYKVIELHGRCGNPYIHRKILAYIDWINTEIDNANSLSQKFPNKYKLLLHPKVYNFIQSEGYTIADMKFRVNYDQITKLLMGESLYGEKKYGLRELIQNAIDACKLKKEILDKKADFGDEEYQPSIKIILDKNANEVIVKDNGVGMDINVLKNYFLRLGASFYKSDDYLLKGYKYKPIGNYGIGFLACFMLSDTVKVRTRHFQDPFLYEVELEKFDEFVCINHNSELQNQGTEIILKYDQFIDVWKDLDDLKTFLKTQFITDEIELQYVNKEKREKETMTNPLYFKSDKYTIELSKYLNDITGQVTLERKIDHLFSSSIQEIDYSGIPHIYNGEKLISIDEDDEKSIDLAEYVVNDTLTLLNVAIVGDGDELEKFIDVAGSESDGFDNYADRYDIDYITILLKSELANSIHEGFVNYNHKILPNLHIYNLGEYGHDTSSSTRIDIEKSYIYSIDNYNLFLLMTSPGMILQQYYNERLKRDLFIRDVFVKHLALRMPNQLRKLPIKECRINVISEEVIANVTRNDLQQDILKTLEYAVYQAICFHLYEQFSDRLKKETIMGYIRKYYGNENKFLKKEYSQYLRLN